MDDHSNKLLSLAKAKECSILNKIRQNQNLKTEAATNLPTMRYASPLTTLHNQPISNVDTSASSNPNKQFCFNFGPTSDKNYYPISGNPHLHFLPHIEEIPDSQRTKPTVSKPNQNFPPVNELLAKLCRGALDKGLLQPPSPIIVPLPVRTFSSPESKKHLNQRNYVTSRGKTNISPLKVILANVPEFHNSPEIKNSEKADQVFTCLTPKNTGQENKENRENILLNMRSPLKKIVVYSHQKDTIIDNVEKEAVVLNEFIKNSPHNSPDLHKLILEDHTYTRVCKKD